MNLRRPRRRRLLLLSTVTLMLSLLAAAIGGTTAAATSHVCVSSFSTSAELAALHFPAITDLVQSIASIIVSPNGAAEPGGDSPEAWPLAALRDAAQGNGTRIWAGLRASPDPATFLAGGTAHVDAAAQRAVQLVAAAGYDGLQIDLEGLRPSSRAAYEGFLASLQRYAAPHNLRLSATVYALKLLGRQAHQSSAYNITRMAQLMTSVFIMGYDLSWLGTPPGTGWKSAGPCAPLDALAQAVEVAVGRTTSDRLVLGLPLYGRLYGCDGAPGAAFRGNCSCAHHNFKKKSVDILAGVVTSTANRAGCTSGWDDASATPFWECARGSGIVAAPNPGGRQQGWYENAKSITAKLNLAAQHNLGGAGFWTGTSANFGSGAAIDRHIWEAIEEFVSVGAPSL